LLWAPVDLGLMGCQLVGIYSGSGRIPLRHSNKWYQSRRPEKRGGLVPWMVVMEPEGHTDGRDWRVELGAWITSSGDHTDGCDGRVGPNVWS
jgi:hypothetical protein